MSEIHKVVCDGCGRRLGTARPGGLKLTWERTQAGSFLAQPPRPLSAGPRHFCGMECLASWIMAASVSVRLSSEEGDHA